MITKQLRSTYFPCGGFFVITFFFFVFFHTTIKRRNTEPIAREEIKFMKKNRKSCIHTQIHAGTRNTHTHIHARQLQHRAHRNWKLQVFFSISLCYNAIEGETKKAQNFVSWKLIFMFAFSLFFSLSSDRAHFYRWRNACVLVTARFDCVCIMVCTYIHCGRATSVKWLLHFVTALRKICWNNCVTFFLFHLCTLFVGNDDSESFSLACMYRFALTHTQMYIMVYYCYSGISIVSKRCYKTALDSLSFFLFLIHSLTLSLGLSVFLVLGEFTIKRFTVTTKFTNKILNEFIWILLGFFFYFCFFFSFLFACFGQKWCIHRHICNALWCNSHTFTM